MKYYMLRLLILCVVPIIFLIVYIVMCIDTLGISLKNTNNNNNNNNFKWSKYQCPKLDMLHGWWVEMYNGYA
jgi:hypothetical protein